MLERLTRFSLERPRTVLLLAAVLTLAFAAQFPRIRIDTDPENMLEADQPDRLLYDALKDEFGINDMIVVGIVDPRGMFRPEALDAVGRAVSRILEIKGVIIEDVVSLTTTDNIRSRGGLLDVRPVMTSVPTASEAREMLREIRGNPFLDEKIASADGSAVAIYVPIRRKDISFRVAGEIRDVLEEELLPGQTYHLAGLPVAEDTFGHEMFVQMAVVAPLAFLGILLLVYLLFRRLAFLLPVGVTAMAAVVWAMGLLIGTGQTVHIMSSMIPVFLMPIAILDDVHILSAVSDTLRRTPAIREAVLEAMRPLYKPMLFTSLTSAVGFASLSLADIPPVRIFGLFVAFGILSAWFLSLTVVPAILSLTGLRGMRREGGPGGGRVSPLDRVLGLLGRLSYGRARLVLAGAGAALVLGVVGISRIVINDNPVKWFKEGHPVRVADRVMNRLFGGTYMVYLLADGGGPEAFKDPERLAYLDALQSFLEEDAVVGKTSSVADIVKRINFVLHDEDPSYDRVPETPEAVGQFLFLFQTSGDPDDLENFLTPDASRANVWIQMRGGDNRLMQRVEDRLDAFLERSPPPSGMRLSWSGLTYINKVWQDLMVFGMLKAILGSFLVVFLLMWFEFRSLALGLLAMVPMTVAILLSYGLIGWIGKDYDMPIAVCSSLSLGLGIDFAIHFIHRFREHYRASGDLQEATRLMFGEPGRAILRNAIVITLGFLPLVASSLTPYVTVGLFFAVLMTFSMLATLLILPAAFRILGRRVLKGGRP
jgi:hypothetical protein